jgi:hypothetical protein
MFEWLALMLLWLAAVIVVMLLFFFGGVLLCFFGAHRSYSAAARAFQACVGTGHRC